MGAVTGRACGDRCTKMLIQRLKRNDIAVIKHRGLDLVAAEELKSKNVRAVINCESTVDGEWCENAVNCLLKGGVDIYETEDDHLLDAVKDGDRICITGSNVYVNGSYCVQCKPVKDTGKGWDTKRVLDEKRRFLVNTITYMNNELEYFLNVPDYSCCECDIKGREVFIVCRGRGYREDLQAVKKYIMDKKPVLIGVDGGANAINDTGLKCDMIIGDMDSVSDSSLLCCHKILVHSYSDGSAPGLQRVKKLGLDCKLIKLKGTSEDAAIFLCGIGGASAIYLIGGHMGVEEFMEKGRKGMGSTALLRVLLGAKIVDLKGISRLSPVEKNFANAAAIIFFLLFIATLLFYNGMFGHIGLGIRALFK